MAQYDNGAAALVKKSHNLVALELSVNKITILEGKNNRKTQDVFLEIIFYKLIFAV